VAIGGLPALVGIIVTLSGWWTPLILNGSGGVSIGGARIWWAAGSLWSAGSR